ncbi:MAG: hypothetical protein ABSD42_10895 [Candidatus Bathyarchaeia archaeon]|jgi:hypothetical protein
MSNVNNSENIIQKAVGLLISALQGEYSDTRDLAVVQLVLLGEKCIPYLVSYLRKQEKNEEDIVEYNMLKDKALKTVVYLLGRHGSMCILPFDVLTSEFRFRCGGRMQRNRVYR